MNPEEVAFIFTTNPAIQIIRQRNARWILPFLFRVFKEENRFLIPEEQLIRLLTETLNSQESSLEDFDEARITFGEDEETRSRKYLLHWVQKRILQDLQDSEGVIQYQLSAYTEKVLQWLLTLQERNHVGTESRFKLLFTSLKDIVENTEDDKTKRLQILKDKRAELDKEIKALEYGVAPDNYSDTQVAERLQLFTRLCYELISDFREVEDNFKQIHRAIVEQHTEAGQNKGAIVGFAFEAYDTLRNSSQGKSFYAFWDFLISRTGQQDWNKLSSQLIDLVTDRNIEADLSFLQNVKTLLLQQGRTVYDANDRMAEKLSRIITEKGLARHRRLREQTGNIKRLILELMEVENVSAGLILDEGADISMVMDRKLQLEQKRVPIQLKQPLNAPEKIADPERFSRLINTAHIDKKKLWKKVELALQSKPTATLKEVLELQPLEQGLAEIVTYYSFVREKGTKVQVIRDTIERIPLNNPSTKFVEVPYLLFSK